MGIRCSVVKGLFTETVIGADFMRKICARIDFHEGWQTDAKVNLVKLRWKLIVVKGKGMWPKWN